MNRRVPLLSFSAGLAVALALGWLAFPRVLYVQAPQPLAFAHSVHTGTAGLACEDCHSVRADGTFTGIPGIAKCAECHAAPLGTSDAEKRLVEAFVTPGREIPWRVYAAQPDNARSPMPLTSAAQDCPASAATARTARPPTCVPTR